MSEKHTAMQEKSEMEEDRKAIGEQIKEWERMKRHGRIAYGVGKHLEDEALMKANRDQMIRAETAIDYLNEKLKELPADEPTA